jgi:hypothetical protein
MLGWTNIRVQRWWYAAGQPVCPEGKLAVLLPPLDYCDKLMRRLRIASMSSPAVTDFDFLCSTVWPMSKSRKKESYAATSLFNDLEISR